VPTFPPPHTERDPHPRVKLDAAQPTQSSADISLDLLVRSFLGTGFDFREVEFLG
jgi:hypothetical protein